MVAISELAKRSTVLGAVLASLPLTSLLAIVWLYGETRDTARVADLASSILWLVLPSLVFFLVLPVLLRRGLAFAPSLAAATALTAVSYCLMLVLLRRFGSGN